MSQAGSISISSSPAVPNTFTTDLLGPAVPVANILGVIGGTSTDDNNNGIQTTGTGNVLKIELTNRLSGTVTTTDDTPDNAIDFIPTVNGSYFFTFSGVGIDTSTLGGVGGNMKALVKVVAGVPTIIDVAENETLMTDSSVVPSLALSDISVFISLGTTVSVQCTGVVGATMDWNVNGTYIFVS